MMMSPVKQNRVICTLLSRPPRPGTIKISGLDQKPGGLPLYKFVKTGNFNWAFRPPEKYFNRRNGLLGTKIAYGCSCYAASYLPSEVEGKVWMIREGNKSGCKEPACRVRILPRIYGHVRTRSRSADLSADRVLSQTQRDGILIEEKGRKLASSFLFRFCLLCSYVH